MPETVKNACQHIGHYHTISGGSFNSHITILQCQLCGHLEKTTCCEDKEVALGNPKKPGHHIFPPLRPFLSDEEFLWQIRDSFVLACGRSGNEDHILRLERIFRTAIERMPNDV